MAKNVNTGTAGIVGDKATNNQVQINSTTGAAPDLRSQLAQLRDAMRAVANTAAEYADLARVAKAAEEPEKAKTALQGAGQWVWDKAQELGLTLLLEWAKEELGLNG